MNATVALAARRTFVAMSLLALMSACGVPMGGGTGGNTNGNTNGSTTGGTGGGNEVSPPAQTSGAVRITNSYSYSIYYIYLSPSNSSQWGTDQLRNRIVSVGASFTITNIPAGRYDLKAVASNGATAYVWDFRVTGGGTMQITID
jgi:hypothetical protein